MKYNSLPSNRKVASSSREILLTCGVFDVGCIDSGVPQYWHQGYKGGQVSMWLVGHYMRCEGMRAEEV